MPTWPAVLVFGTTVMIGGYLGWQFLLGEKRKQMLVAIHLLLGVAGLEVVALMLHGAPDGSVTDGAWLGKAAGLVLAGALLSGFMVPLIARPKPSTAVWMIGLHASIGTAGFLALILWIMRM